ncbi:MAG TPA: acyl-ACP desaturase [Acidimicrobiales bacterium]|nr:acyl-ACP desaturase [Acidimicrobiales bacterium]
MDDRMVIAELEPRAAELLDRHLSNAKEWFPHELVPWSLGRDFDKDYRWEADELAPPPAVRSALFVNLLTEDNLPYYSMEIHDMFGVDGAWGEWARRWTAEEGRHSIVIRDWLTVTRSIDPVWLERGRMAQVSGGIAPKPASPVGGLAYVTLQELATRIAHHNTGKLLADRPGHEIMRRVAADENLHYLFYRDMTTACLEIDPSATVIAIEAEVRDFAMPGVGITDFSAHAAAIAKAGIYDLSIHHDQILVPVVLRHWKVEDVVGLSDEAEQARDRLLTRIERIGRAAARLRERQERTPGQDALAPA